MLRDCLPHNIWIIVTETARFATDDFTVIGTTLTTCQLECRICREDCPGLPPEAIDATVDLDAVDSMPSRNTLRPESREFWQSPALATGWPLEVDVSMWPDHPLEHLQHIAQQLSTVQTLFKPLTPWNRHPDPTGEELPLHHFENFQHIPLLFEIVAGFHCHPLGVQIVFPRMTCDAALRMAAHLPDAGRASAAATTAAIAGTAATGATAATAVGAAAG